MAADSFFSRWSKAKPSDYTVGQAQLHAGQDPQNLQNAGPAGDIESPSDPLAEALPPPTMEDVASLTQDSDFSRFVGKDVDDSVKRSAMKKLFSNPHFNVMDRLDVYIDDYNKFTPLTATMLASLNHAKDLLKPLQAAEHEQIKPAATATTTPVGEGLSPANEEVAEAGSTDSAEASNQTDDGRTVDKPVQQDIASDGSANIQASAADTQDQHLPRGG